MTHDPSHTLFFIAGSMYFLFTAYFSLRNYRLTKQEGFWFLTTLFSLNMTGAMIAGALWSSKTFTDETIHPYYSLLFLSASIFLLTSTYTLQKRHHKVKLF